jgi:hypothetical protein
MKNLSVLLALTVLSACSSGYNTEEPQNKGDFVAAVMLGVASALPLSETQRATYWACMEPRIPKIAAKLTVEEASYIDQTLTALEEDPDAFRPDLGLMAAALLPAAIMGHGGEDFRDCMSDTGIPMDG